jgi:hypothetical protein
MVVDTCPGLLAVPMPIFREGSENGSAHAKPEKANRIIGSRAKDSIFSVLNKDDFESMLDVP